MKCHLFTLITVLGLTVSFTSSASEPTGKATLAVVKVKATPAIVGANSRASHSSSLNRVIESLDGQLIDALNQSRKFVLVGRSDLPELAQEAALSGTVDLRSADFSLVTTVDDFADYTEVATFQDTGRQAQKRIIRISAVAKIYETSTQRLLESASFQLSQKDIANLPGYSTRSGDLSDELLVAISRTISARISDRVVDVIYPAKVLVKRDKVITVNRGDGTDIRPGQIWAVYALGEALIDPDTGENLGSEEVLIGKAKVTSVKPKFSEMQLIEDRGVERGQIVRLQP